MDYAYKNQYGVFSVQDKATLNEPKEIRFITPSYNTIFTIPDGEQVIVCFSDGKKKPYTCKYIDETHLLLGNSAYHICELAERMQSIRAHIVPYAVDSYKMLPLSDFSKNVFGECAEDFDEILKHPDRNDAFWSTRYGGGEAHEAIKYARIPILLVTGFYDIYTGGVFDMWRGLDDETRSLCALAVHPFDHGCKGETQPINFENGTLSKEFENYKVRWLDSIRKNTEPPFQKGKITYYKLFDGTWQCDDFYDANEAKRIPLGEGSVTYRYNPYAPASFKGGLSANFGGNAWQDKPNSRYDIISLYTPEFEEDTFIKGNMSAKLTVKSDCEDTCFYIRLSLCKEVGDYGLRDDINQISNFDVNYKRNREIEIKFSFDEHAFVVKKGERIRIDISSSAFPHYVPHTNQKGLFSEQTSARIATNTVVLQRSYLELPILKELSF